MDVPPPLLECVVNVSEGRREEVLTSLRMAAGADVLDVHRDGDHHRAVFTLVGEEAPRRLATAAVQQLDLRQHEGVHPRFGVVDVVPFVPLAGATMHDAVDARNRFAAWAAAVLDVPCFLYGPERTLPDVRRHAFAELHPDYGPDHPHPTAGAIAVGARAVLVAYNVWLAGDDLAGARRIAAQLRSPHVRALAFRVHGAVQVSMNLIAADLVGPAAVYDQVAAAAGELDPPLLVQRAELVGLVPDAVLQAVPPARWRSLDLDADRTIEARLALRPQT